MDLPRAHSASCLLLSVAAFGCGLSELFPHCEPASCESLHATCGPVADGCGGQLECGTCGLDQRCAATASGLACEHCIRLTCEVADGRCGELDDSCGGSVECGCPDQYTCEAGRCQRPPWLLSHIDTLVGPGQDTIHGVGLDSEGTVRLIVRLGTIGPGESADLGLGPVYDPGMYLIARKDRQTKRVTKILDGGTAAFAPNGHVRVLGRHFPWGPDSDTAMFWQEYDANGNLVDDRRFLRNYWTYQPSSVVVNNHSEFAYAWSQVGGGVVQIDWRKGTEAVVFSALGEASHCAPTDIGFSTDTELIVIALIHGRCEVGSGPDQLIVDAAPWTLAMLRLTEANTPEILSLFEDLGKVCCDGPLIAGPAGLMYVPALPHLPWLDDDAKEPLPSMKFVSSSGERRVFVVPSHPSGWIQHPITYGADEKHGVAVVYAENPDRGYYSQFVLQVLDERLQPGWRYSFPVAPPSVFITDIAIGPGRMVLGGRFSDTLDTGETKVTSRSSDIVLFEFRR